MLPSRLSRLSGRSPLHRHNLTYPLQPAAQGSGYVAQGWGWGTYILPYIDQANLYNTIQPGTNQTLCDNATDVPSYLSASAAASIQAIQRMALPAYSCPSATDPDQIPTRGSVGAGNGNSCGSGAIGDTQTPTVHGKSNYRAIAGWNWEGMDTTAELPSFGAPAGNNTNAGTHGMFGDGTVWISKLANITDGTSSTFGFGECYHKHTSNYAQCVYKSYSAANPATNSGDYVGSHWFGSSADQRQSVAVGLLVPPPTTLTINGASINAFASQHVGGAHFLAADGHVVFVSQNVDQTLLSNLGQIDDGTVANLP